MKGKKIMKGINQKGFGHHILIIIVAVLAVGAVGFAGWRIYSAKKLDAQAASYNYKNIASALSGILRIEACLYDNTHVSAKYVNTGHKLVSYSINGNYKWVQGPAYGYATVYAGSSTINYVIKDNSGTYTSGSYSKYNLPKCFGTGTILKS